MSIETNNRDIKQILTLKNSTIMKTKRSFEFVLTVNNNEELPIMENQLCGEEMFRSECHYYAEKEIVSCIKEAERGNRLNEYPFKYTIYKVGKTVTETTENEDGSKTVREIPGAAQLIETIYVEDGNLVIC